MSAAFLPIKTKWVLSVILPGIKPQFFGNALRDSIEGKTIAFNDRDQLFDGLDESIHPADRTVSIWAHRSRFERQILHGRELVDLWDALSDDLWITVIGNPLWRALDCYRNIGSNPAHPLHPELTRCGWSLGEFYASPLAASVCNRQCRKLARLGGVAPAELAFARASRALERFACIGLEGVDAGPQTRLAQCLETHGYLCDVPILPTLNPPKDLPNAATEEIIRKAEWADFALWDVVKKKRTLTKAANEY